MIRQNWQMFSGSLSSETCEHMIQTFSKLPEKQGGTFGDIKDHRRSKVRWIEGEHGLRDILMAYVHQANTAFCIDIHPIITELQFTEYSGEYKGKYDVHHDINWNESSPSDRKLSLVIQLSDPNHYVGGDFSFSEVENPISGDMKKQGTVLVFPSYLQHSVSEVTEGKRYSLVSWVSGPRWR